MYKKNEVYTIIVTYNGMKWIKDCISSVYKNTRVVIIDNNSSDNTVAYIQENFSKVKIFNQKKNLGFGKANNIGITYALSEGAEFVFLLNQDAKILEDSIKKMIKFSLNNKEYGVLSPLHCDWSGQFLEDSFSRYMGLKFNTDFYSDFILLKKIKEVYDVPFIAAACWFIPKRVFEKVGGFDPMFFHLGEDINYAQRIIYHKYKIGVLPSCKVLHDTKGRVYNVPVKYSDEYFYKSNYLNKIKYGDVNKKNIYNRKANFFKRQIYKDIIFFTLQLKFKKLYGALKELKIFKKMIQECKKSISLNSTIGKHYLNKI